MITSENYPGNYPDDFNRNYTINAEDTILIFIWKYYEHLVKTFFQRCSYFQIKIWKCNQDCILCVDCIISVEIIWVVVWVVFWCYHAWKIFLYICSESALLSFALKVIKPNQKKFLTLQVFQLEDVRLIIYHILLIRASILLISQ